MASGDAERESGVDECILRFSGEWLTLALKVSCAWIDKKADNGKSGFKVCQRGTMERIVEESVEEKDKCLADAEEAMLERLLG